MTFMYLHLRAEGDRIRASVKNHGALPFSSLGGPDSRVSDHPFAVFQLDGFDGLEFMNNGELLDELDRRMLSEQILARYQRRQTPRELMQMLAERLGERLDL